MKPPEDARGRPPAGAAAQTEHHSPRQDNRPRAAQVNANHTTQPPLPGLEGLNPGDLAAWEAASDAFFDRAEVTGAIFSAVDHREVVGMPPANPNRVGLAFGRASRSGRFEELGAVRSPAPSRRAGLVRLWRVRRTT